MTGHWNSSLGKDSLLSLGSTWLMTLDVKEMLPRVTRLALQRAYVRSVDDVDLHILHEAVHCVQGGYRPETSLSSHQSGPVKHWLPRVKIGRQRREQ